MYCTHCGIENEHNANDCRSCGEEFVKDIWDRERPGAETVAVVYAGFWKRAAAIVIDSFLLFFVDMGLGLLYLTVMGNDEGIEAASKIFGIIFGWLYFAGMESSIRQGTIGKTVMRIIVTDIKGDRLSFYRASGRHFAKFVSSLTLGVGFVMAGFTEKKQALHDKMFDCLVVVKR